MEEDKKKQVIGNGLATESESPVVAKVQILNYKQFCVIDTCILALVIQIMLVKYIHFLLSLRTPRTAPV